MFYLGSSCRFSPSILNMNAAMFRSVAIFLSFVMVFSLTLHAFDFNHVHPGEVVNLDNHEQVTHMHVPAAQMNTPFSKHNEVGLKIETNFHLFEEELLILFASVFSILFQR